MHFVKLTFASLAFVCSQPSAAQIGDFGGSIISSAIGNVGIQSAMRQATSRSTQQLQSAQQKASPTQLASLAYRAAPARTRTNLARFVEKTRALDPTGAAQMERLFASTDIIAQMDRMMQQTYGMRANNVADAYAMWWTSAWNGAQGRNDDPSAGQMAMVKRQAANALAATPEFAAATDAGKQELAEALLVQAAMIQGAIDTYKSDPAMLAKARAAIAKGAKGMGLNLEDMTLTDEGFVPASRKTGAVDTSKETQLAGAQPTQAVGNDNPPYLLMAAAGGAGISGVFMLGKMMGRRE